MYVKTTREPQGGDIFYRQKENGNGLHWGRIIESAEVFAPEVIDAFNFPPILVPHTTPSMGKHLDTVDGFFAGQPGGWIPLEMQEPARLEVQQASVSNLGDPYTLAATCEDDVFGFSPTRNRIVEGIAGLLLVVVAGAVVANFQD